MTGVAWTASKNKFMDTFCPKCKHPQKISSRQLKKKYGRISCTQCKHKFNPHTSISEQTPPENEPVISETYPWQKTSVPHNKHWIAGSLVAILLFCYQLIYFTGYPLAQNAQLRPWLETLSNKFDYPLPSYRNLAEFTTIGSAIIKLNDNNYRLQISIINHADFEQHLPALLVTLHNQHGGQFAQRAFSSREYLGKDHPSIFIASSATADIDFFIGVPEQDIGGYSIELK